MLTSKKIALSTIITVFLLGIVLGMVADRYVLLKIRHHRNDDGKDFLVKMFTKELNLNAEQIDTLKILLKELRENHENLKKIVGPQFEELTENFRLKFATVLTPKQQEKFTKMNNDYDKKVKSRPNERDDTGKRKKDFKKE